MHLTAKAAKSRGVISGSYFKVRLGTASCISSVNSNKIRAVSESCGPTSAWTKESVKVRSIFNKNKRIAALAFSRLSFNTNGSSKSSRSPKYTGKDVILGTL